MFGFLWGKKKSPKPTNTHTIPAGVQLSGTARPGYIKPEPMLVDPATYPDKIGTVAPNLNAPVNEVSQDEDLMLFAETLVQAIFGVKLEDVEPSKRGAVARECLDIFSDYIVSYVETNYGKRESIRLKASQAFPESNIFTRFPDLQPVFESAYTSFVNLLSSNSTKKA